MDTKIEYFRTYMRPKTGMASQYGKSLRGRMAGERDLVGRNFLAPNVIMQRILRHGFLSYQIMRSEYKPLRDKVLTEEYLVKDLWNMYDRYKPIGQGAFGCGF